jgi:hypothetical protein
VSSIAATKSADWLALASASIKALAARKKIEVSLQVLGALSNRNGCDEQHIVLRRMPVRNLLPNRPVNRSFVKPVVELAWLQSLTT